MGRLCDPLGRHPATLPWNCPKDRGFDVWHSRRIRYISSHFFTANEMGCGGSLPTKGYPGALGPPAWDLAPGSERFHTVHAERFHTVSKGPAKDSSWKFQIDVPDKGFTFLGLIVSDTCKFHIKVQRCQIKVPYLDAFVEHLKLPDASTWSFKGFQVRFRNEVPDDVFLSSFRTSPFWERYVCFFFFCSGVLFHRSWGLVLGLGVPPLQEDFLRWSQ